LALVTDLLLYHSRKGTAVFNITGQEFAGKKAIIDYLPYQISRSG